jgi:hypothetical protein
MSITSNVKIPVGWDLSSSLLALEKCVMSKDYKLSDDEQKSLMNVREYLKTALKGYEKIDIGMKNYIAKYGIANTLKIREAHDVVSKTATKEEINQYINIFDTFSKGEYPIADDIEALQKFVLDIFDSFNNIQRKPRANKLNGICYRLANA